MNKAFIKQIQKINLYPYYKGLYRGINSAYRALPSIGRGAARGTAYAFGVPVFFSALGGLDDPGKAVLLMYKNIFTSIKNMLTNTSLAKSDIAHFSADK